MKIRYGIRWDGRGGRPKARLVALGAALLGLMVPAAAQADAGDDAAVASAQRVAAATGIAPGAPDGTGIDVALIDSGVAPIGSLAQPGRVVHGPDFSSESRNPRLARLDTFGHGTHLAGLIAGRDPVTGFGGVAPGARIVSLKIAGSQGTTTLEQVLLALEWVHRNHDAPGYNIRVVNLSLGVEDTGGYRNDILAWAVEELWREGIVVVAAAGNNGLEAKRLDIPAADPFVIAAGATDMRGTPDPADDVVADFSSRSTYRSPDVVAPGASLVSLRVPGSALDLEFPAARIGGDYFRGSGTSQAAAVVSGIAARILSARPNLNPDQLKAVLNEGAVDMAEPRDADGNGRVHLARSLNAAVPSFHAAKQNWLVSLLDRRTVERLLGVGGDDDDRGDRRYRESDTEWSGRRWSGRRWSGRRWSGASWVSTG